MSGIKIKLKYLLLVVILGVAMHGCNVINPSEPVPTYIHIDSFRWDSAAATHGLARTYQVNTVWVYYNNNPIGEFDLPATFPVITNGTGQLSFYPGITVDGQNNFNTKYPFYVSDTLTLAPQPGKKITYNPKTSFYSDIKDTVLSNFEFQTGFSLCSGSVPLSLDPSSPLTGVINLNAATNDTLSEDSSRINFPIPLNTQAYIELDYKNTVPFYLGMRATVGGVLTTKLYLAGIAPSDHWQKFYFAVADFAGQYKADYYQLYIKSSLDPGVASGQVLLKNIQFIHF